MNQYNFPRPTLHDLLAALHMLFGAHQFVLVHPEAPTTIHPRARMLLSELAPGAIWPSPKPNRPLNEAEQFQLSHTAAYLYPTNAAVDTLAAAPGFPAWLQRQQHAQATDPAFKYISPQNELETVPAPASAPRPPTPAAAAPKPAPRAVTANHLAAAQISAVVASHSSSAVAAAAKSPYLTPSSAVIASLLRGNKFQPAVVPTGQISSLPPQFVPAPAAPSAPASVAPTLLPSPKQSPLLPKPSPPAAPSQPSNLPSVNDPASWAMPFRLWLLRNYDPIPASVIEAAANKHSNAAATPVEDSPMFFIDTAGAGAEPAPKPADSAAAANTGADELQQISPSASVLWSEFAKTISWSNGVVPKRPKHLTATVDETAQKIWGVPPHLGSNFLWGNKTFKLQKKKVSSSSNAVTAATTRASTSAASAAVDDSDMPPLETSSGEQVTAARLAAASASLAPQYRVGDIVDCCDLTHFWLEAEILNVDPANGYRVTFLGYESKWDETIAFDAAKDRIAARYTHVARPKHVASKLKTETVAAAATPAAPVPSPSPPIPRTDPNGQSFRYLDTSFPYTSVAGLETPSAMNPFGIPGWHLPASEIRKMTLSPTAIAELVARQVRVTHVFDGKNMLNIESMAASFANDIDARLKMKLSQWQTHVRTAATAMGVNVTDPKYPLPGFRRRDGMFHLLKDSKIALRAHLGGVAAINSAAAAGENVAEKAAEVAAASAANAVRAPKEWTPQPPVLMPPTDANPLGLTPGPAPGAAPRVLTNVVVTELFLRWMRVAYQFSAKKSTPIAALMDQLRKDVPEEFGVIRKARVTHLLPDAIGLLYGEKAKQRADVLAHVAKFPITRRIQATCITTRLATATDVTEANLNMRMERKRVHDAMNPKPAQQELTVELDDADGPSADQTAAAEQTTTVAQPPPSKRQRNGPADDSAADAASSPEAPLSSEAGDAASLSATAEYASTQATLDKVVKSLGKTTASVAELTEQERTLTAQLDAVRAKKARKQAKLVALVAQEKHLDHWLTVNSPQAKAAKLAKAAAKASKKASGSSVQPQAQPERKEEPEPAAAALTDRAPSPAVDAAVAPISAPPAVDSAMVDVAASPAASAFASSLPASAVVVPVAVAFDDLPVPELPPQFTQESMSDEATEESHAQDATGSSEAASAAAAGRLAASSPSFTLASPSPVASAASPASAPVSISVTVRVATVADAAAVSAFLHRQFNDTFAPHNTESDMAAYCASAFSPAIQASEIADPNVTVFVAENAAGQLVGVAMTRAGSVEPCVSDPAALEVQRIYGVGVGRPLMRACLRHALWLGHRCTFLGVWEHNKKAVAFYTRWGYRDVGSHVFPLGSDLQTDRIMQRDVEPTQPMQEPPSAMGTEAVVDFAPLPAESATIGERVLHAVTHAPQTELERAHGVSVLQIACWLRVTEAQVNEACALLCQQQRLRATRDQQHFKTTQQA